MNKQEKIDALIAEKKQLKAEAKAILGRQSVLAKHRKELYKIMDQIHAINNKLERLGVSRDL